jgi:hypothetical protein
MRSYDANSGDDREEAQRLGAPAWMLDVLAMNPEYVYWGPHEDYMCSRDAGWRAPAFTPAWAAFGLTLDELNEVANFYFSIQRDNETCSACGGGGYNPGTREIADAFYADGPEDPRRWCDRITQDEVTALIEHHRIPELTGQRWHPETKTYSIERTPAAEDVNAWERRRGIGHDAINRGILVEARARRLGVWGEGGLCPTCKGHGSVFTAPECRLALTLWVLHPRKGASRGWEIASVQRDELPAAFAFLHEAAARNAARFAKLTTPTPAEPVETKR